MFKHWLNSVENSFTTRLCKEFSLNRNVTSPENQAVKDRLLLLFRIWPFFYFNYVFAKSFEQRVEQLIINKQQIDFQQELAKLFQLHYFSAILNLSSKEIQQDKLFRTHFSEMQYGIQAISSSRGKSATEIIESALAKMLYHDITYNWSRSPAFGVISNYYSAKSFLYMVKRKITTLSHNEEYPR
ncbi:MAG: hypothetical protein HOM14_04700 [Gammaproteobacteria bacterium]|jgi:hypothetical protein|nr:hypothetical protein [Gammaproteobacteria bacterium]MBT3723106.1 hypothetical protein [Gammaproteobacteria bacterium]MBT4075792.1 hypothetical protein [Gammaproteobacteria bacterium]MBT4192745.1 hypothetical protein [Gammaproteobacteria bacterium]MBT4448437.1 hypothetical protein [Gammaproteobacteria bacterium]